MLVLRACRGVPGNFKDVSRSMLLLLLLLLLLLTGRWINVW